MHEEVQAEMAHEKALEEAGEIYAALEDKLGPREWEYAVLEDKLGEE